MLCFIDMSFCSDSKKCENRFTCNRWFNEEQEKEAEKWWGKEGAPIAFMSFKDNCKDYKDIKDE